MSFRNEKTFLNEIVSFIDEVNEMSIDNFRGRERMIELIGEAINQLSKIAHSPEVKEFCNKNRGACDMRNYISHAYFEIDTKIVNYTIKNDLPILKKEIKKLINIK